MGQGKLAADAPQNWGLTRFRRRVQPSQRLWQPTQRLRPLTLMHCRQGLMRLLQSLAMRRPTMPRWLTQWMMQI
jgi:hypothetical protein